MERVVIRVLFTMPNCEAAATYQEQLEAFPGLSVPMPSAAYREPAWLAGGLGALPAASIPAGKVDYLVQMSNTAGANGVALQL